MSARTMQNLPFLFTMWKKFRLYAFAFPIVICGITCCTLLNKIHVGVRVIDDVQATDAQRNDTGASKPAARYSNLPSFLPSRMQHAVSFTPRNHRTFQKPYLSNRPSNSHRMNNRCSMLHSSELIRKCSSRLYFLRQLKRSGVAPSELVQFYGGWFLLFSRSGGHKTKETYPTRPGSPTPCKQGLSVQKASNILTILNNNQV